MSARTGSQSKQSRSSARSKSTSDASDRSESSASSSSSASESSTSSAVSTTDKGHEERTQNNPASYSAAQGNFAPSQKMDRTQMDLAGASKRAEAASTPTGAPKVDRMEQETRKLMIMRCAERLDQVHPSYLTTAFTDMEKYKMHDLNMPVKLPTRANGKRDFQLDTPISELGNSCAQLTGRGFLLNGIKLDRIIVSPAFRCVATAHRIIRAMNQKPGGCTAKICIEPGLFEYLGWYEELPNWMSVDEWLAEQYPVDPSYKPVLTQEQLFQMKGEDVEAYYRRICDTIDMILAVNSDAKNTLIIGHASTVDAGTRRLRRLELSPPPEDDMQELSNAYPYGSMITVQQNQSGAWRHCHNPVPVITYVDFSNRIDVKTFAR